MSQLDQAFIRAYNRKLAAGRQAASGAPPVPQDSAIPADTVLEAVAQLLHEATQPLSTPQPAAPHFVTSATAGTHDMQPVLPASLEAPSEPQASLAAPSEPQATPAEPPELAMSAEPPVAATPPTTPAPLPAPAPAPDLQSPRVPHPTLESPVAAVSTPVAQQAIEPVSTPPVESRSGSFLQPLSQVLGLYESPSQGHAPFRAAWEVDSFQWPEVCDLLLEASAELLDEIAGRIHFTASTGRNLLAVRGSGQGTGATAAAAFFARVMAGTGLHVALVDGHLAKPQLGKQLGLGQYTGWDQALAGEAPLEETAVASVGDALTLLPLGELSEPQQLQIDPERVAENLHLLAADFDLIVIDAGAVSLSSRRLAGLPGLPSEMAATLLVTDARRSGRRPAAARRLIADGGELLIGTFENFAPSADATSSPESMELPSRKLAA